MAIDLSEERAIDARNEGFRRMLENLQGNILKGHGREHVRLLLLQFPEEAGSLVPWMQSTTRAVVTSAKRQLSEIEDHRMGRKTGVFGNFFLTAEGYRVLGYEGELLDFCFGEAEKQIRFSLGMRAAAEELGDGGVGDGNVPYEGIHAMLLLASDRPRLLEEVDEEITAGLELLNGRVRYREFGRVLRESGDKRGDPVEPFGYVDGRSQPLFFSEDLERERRRGGINSWNPLAPLGLVLVPDPFTGEEDSFGSFVVFRKLEQNVEGFEENLAGASSEKAGAQVVGRFKNGTPVAKHEVPIQGAARRLNNFDYSQDPSGERCPFHAHIRAINGRQEKERQHRIVRRGVPYDDRSLFEPDVGSQGMLFLSFQASIAEQFAVLQKRLAASAGNGFNEYIKLRGGEFFFAPSIPFLLNPISGRDG